MIWNILFYLITVKNETNYVNTIYMNCNEMKYNILTKLDCVGIISTTQR